MCIQQCSNPRRANRALRIARTHLHSAPTTSPKTHSACIAYPQLSSWLLQSPVGHQTTCRGAVRQLHLNQPPAISSSPAKIVVHHHCQKQRLLCRWGYQIRLGLPRLPTLRLITSALFVLATQGRSATQTPFRSRDRRQQVRTSRLHTVESD
jgi:hypothetical protein